MTTTKPSFINRFMNITGKTRAILGPAEVSSINRALTPEKAAELQARQDEVEAQFRTVERADGTFYIVPNDK